MVGEISAENAGHQSVNISPETPIRFTSLDVDVLSTRHDFRIVRDRKNLSTAVSTTRFFR